MMSSRDVSRLTYAAVVVLMWQAIAPAELPEATYDPGSSSIQVKGVGNNLASIMADVGDKKVFRYADGIAFCRASLIIAPGATLAIGGPEGSARSEVLRMDCGKGEYAIVVKGGESQAPPGRLVVTDSVIAPRDIRSYYRWDVRGRIELTRSEIVGSDCLFLRQRCEVMFSDATIESFGQHRRAHSYSPLYIQSAAALSINGLKIIGGGGYAFHLQCPATTYNVDIDGDAHIRYSAVWRAVNCRFDGVRLQEYKGRSGRVIRSWYLDLSVTDETGEPIAGATVEITNDMDNQKFPALNCNDEKTTKTVTCDGKGLTPIGHTPLPSDDPDKSLVIFDYAQFSKDKELRCVFDTKKTTHTVVVAKEGYTPARITIDPDDSWYRPHPDKPTKTIAVSLRRR